MSLTPAEKILAIMRRRGMTLTDLAEITGQSRQNLSNKLSRDNFSYSDLVKLAAALGCSYDGVFTMDDTGERI